MDRLEPATSVVLVVDVQERLSAAIPPAAMARLVTSTRLLLDVAGTLKVPVMASEQYTKGLGKTIAPLAEKLEALGVTPIEKIAFDACGEPRVVAALAERAPRAVIVVGIETHVCVFQTARELVRRGYVTHVVADAVASRTEENRAIGLDLCARAGAVVTCAEATIFDWLERAGTDTFRAVSRLVVAATKS